MEKVIVTGAAGFTGANLVEHLVEHGYFVYAVCRPKSKNNVRLLGVKNVQIVELDTREIRKLVEHVTEKCDYFVHLSWQGTRDDVWGQLDNVQNSLHAIEAAKRAGCKRYIQTGSQAEYGLKSELITEDLIAEPFSAYGAAKLSACYQTKILAKQLGVDWIWGRIFSTYGKYEPQGRMLPDLISKLKNGEQPILSSCEQYWDYLDEDDAAEAIIALMERGHDGEIYNIANGNFRQLKEYTEAVRKRINPNITISYGDDPNPFVSLQPSVEKIKTDTGWVPRKEFTIE